MAETDWNASNETFAEALKKAMEIRQGIIGTMSNTSLPLLKAMTRMARRIASTRSLDQVWNDTETFTLAESELNESSALMSNEMTDFWVKAYNGHPDIPRSISGLYKVMKAKCESHAAATMSPLYANSIPIKVIQKALSGASAVMIWYALRRDRRNREKAGTANIPIEPED